MNVVDTGSRDQNRPASTENANESADLAGTGFGSTCEQLNKAAPSNRDSSEAGDVAANSSATLRRSSAVVPFEPLADGSFSSVGPDSAIFNRFDQATLVGLLLFSSLCLIGWSTWQWLTLRSRTIDIDQARRTELRFEVDLNLAPAAEFANLPGVGPKLAEEIVAYRQQTGRFNQFEDLLNVSGIGEAKFKAILPFLRPLEPQQTPPAVR